MDRKVWRACPGEVTGDHRRGIIGTSPRTSEVAVFDRAVTRAPLALALSLATVLVVGLRHGDRGTAYASAFAVTTTADAGAGSLRQAMLDANAHAGSDSITFSISPGGLQTIDLLSPLPSVADPAVIDATTQPGYAGAPLIQLNGTGAGVLADGFLVTAGDTTVKGFVINRFGASGLELAGNSGNVVSGNYVGLNAAGTAALANGNHGVLINGSASNVIGGTTAADRNVLSGNAAGGIVIDGATAIDNAVEGNLVGTDRTGVVAIGNGYPGNLLISGAASSNTIGGLTAGSRNVFSGGNATTTRGIEINGSKTTNNVVVGNYVGTNISGSAALGNLDGIWINGAPGNTIGGTTPGSGNLISGNNSFGLLISGANNIVQGNLIGTDVTGTNRIGNSAGVQISNAPGNIVGGTDLGARNVISGNGSGVDMGGSQAMNNVVQGNFIGVDITGTHALSNFGNGVAVSGSSPSHNLIGGTSAGAGNVISGNGIWGIDLEAGATANTVQGNLIGTDVTGTIAIGNSSIGVHISFNSPANMIGGTEPGSGNVIGGTTNGNGIQIDDTGSPYNVIQGNWIGVDKSGLIPVRNRVGILIEGGAHNTTIGGTAAGAGNLISGNVANGIEIMDSGTTGNFVQQNLIGTTFDGASVLANGRDGILISGGNGNVIGGTTAGARNVVSGNTLNGIEVVNTAAPGNQIEGNYVGTDATGTARLANGGSGVLIGGNAASTDGNTIGGVAAGARNVISGNGQAGVNVSSNAHGNEIVGNFIGGRADLIGPLSNGGDGVFLHSGATSTLVGANVIAGNAANGVRVDGSAAPTNGNPIRINDIFANGAKGIADVAGGNLGLLPPVVAAVTLRITASGIACPNCGIDLFTDFEDEGGTYQASVVADGAGRWSWSGSLATGYFVTATATDSGGNTSPFSAPFPIDGDGDGYSDSAEVALGRDPSTYCKIMRADVDGDGSVSILDLAAVAQYFLQTVTPATARFNQDADNAISILDLATMSGSFLRNVRSCP